jgi:hypothetical protein
VKVQLHTFLTSATDEGEWAASQYETGWTRSRSPGKDKEKAFPSRETKPRKLTILIIERVTSQFVLLTECTLRQIFGQIHQEGRDATTMGEKRTAYRNLVGKYDGKRQLGTSGSKYRWEGNITTGLYLHEIRYKGVDWIRLAQDRNQWRTVVNTAMKPRVT